MTSLSPLQLALKSAYESGTDNLNVQQNMLNHLGDGCFYLQDFEMDLVEIPYLIKFLQSKVAIKEIVSVELVLKPGVAPEQRRRKPTVHAKQVTKQGESASNKLLTAVFDFIRSSHGMESIILDNVTLTHEQITKLSESMSAMQSRLNKVALTGCPIGSQGLRILTPAINKHHTITQVIVKGCGLTNESANFLTAILRASVAHMDQLYWNSTLRMSDPIDGSLDSGTSGAVMNEDTNHVFSSGLLVLDISDNELTSDAVNVLSRQLKNNHWLLALDLSGNRIDEEGIVLLAEALAAGENSALGTILVRGNPGFSKAAYNKLQDVTDAASDRLDCMPADLYEVLKDLDTLRMAESATASGLTTKAEDELENKTEDKDGSEEVNFRADGGTGGMAAPCRVDGQASDGGPDIGLDMEFSIPTPVDGDTTTFQGSPTQDLDPAASPAALLAEDSVRSASDSGVDGRPISRGSLRPRPQSGGGAGMFSPLSTVAGAAVSSDLARGSGYTGGASNRRKVNRGGFARSQGSVKTAADMEGGKVLPGVGSLDSVDLLNGPGLAVAGGAMTMVASFESGEASSPSQLGFRGPGGVAPPRAPPSSFMQAARKERKPFYPGGTGRTYQKARDGLIPNPRLRAANYSEQVRILQLCAAPLPAPAPRVRGRKKKASKTLIHSTGIATADAATTTASMMSKKNAMTQAHTTASDSKALVRNASRRAKASTRDKTDERLEKLTGAVERVSRQLETATEKMNDLSDSLSESVMNFSFNSSRQQNTTDMTSASVENSISEGARRKTKASQHKASGSLSPSRHSSSSKEPVASSLADVVEAPSPVKSGDSGRTSESPVLTGLRGVNGASKQSQRNSPGSSPSNSPSRTKNRDKDVSRIIRNSMREKLDRFLDELQF